MTLALYHNDMSLCAQKARVCLAEKGLPWEDRHLVLRDGTHQQDWYRKLNPRAVVPTLIDGDKVIPESNVILEYLEDAYPEPRLSPRDAYGRAKMRLWTRQLDEDLHDASAAIISFGIAFRHQYLERGELGMQMLEQDPKSVQARTPARRDREGTGFGAFQDRSSTHAPVSGRNGRGASRAPMDGVDEYTLADVAFTPYLLRLEHLDLVGMIDERPRVADWYKRCQARPSFQEALRKWENPKYLSLMKQRGMQHWPQVRAIMAAA